MTRGDQCECVNQPTNHCRSRKSPESTSRPPYKCPERACVLALITQPAGRKAGLRVPHSHCHGTISSGELMVLAPASHTLHPLREASTSQLLWSVESPGKEQGDPIPALALELMSCVTLGR